MSKENINPFDLLNQFSKGTGQIPDQIKKMQAELERIQKMTGQYTLDKEMNVVINGKKGKMMCTTGKTIVFYLEDCNEADIKTILQRVHD